jgi:hypothetical protein
MCSTCCALGVVGEYRKHKLLVAKNVVIRLCVCVGGRGAERRGENYRKMILRKN